MIPGECVSLDEIPQGGRVFLIEVVRRFGCPDRQRGQIGVPLRGIIAECGRHASEAGSVAADDGFGDQLLGELFRRGKLFRSYKQPELRLDHVDVIRQRGPLGGELGQGLEPSLGAVGRGHHDAVRRVEVFVGCGERFGACFRVPGPVQHLRQHEVEEEGMPDVGDLPCLSTTKEHGMPFWPEAFMYAL